MKKYFSIFILCVAIVLKTNAQKQDTIPPKTLVNQADTTIVIEIDAQEKKEEDVVVNANGGMKKSPVKPVEQPVAYREISMNMTTLISRIAPFSNAIALSGPTTLYLKNYKGNKATRFGIGLQATPDAENINTILRLGKEYKKELGKKWVATRAGDLLIASGNFNTPGFDINDDSQFSMGGAIAYSIGYKINEYVYLSTETTVYLGVRLQDDAQLDFKIIPPIALYLNVKLY